MYTTLSPREFPDDEQLLPLHPSTLASNRSVLDRARTRSSSPVQPSQVLPLPAHSVRGSVKMKSIAPPPNAQPNHLPETYETIKHRQEIRTSDHNLHLRLELFFFPLSPFSIFFFVVLMPLPTSYTESESQHIYQRLRNERQHIPVPSSTFTSVLVREREYTGGSPFRNRFTSPIIGSARVHSGSGSGASTSWAV